MVEDSWRRRLQVDLTKANAVEFNTKDEPWIKYKLDDGTVYSDDW